MATTTHLEHGMQAPTFRASDEAGHVHDLAGYRGKTLVLCFLPQGMGPAGRNLREHYPGTASSDIFLLGVMPGSPEAVGEFRKDHDVPFPILADDRGKIADAYGMTDLVQHEKHMGFVAVDADGKIELVLKRHSNPRRVYELLRRV